MPLVKPTVFDGSIQRQMFPGDTMAQGEIMPATIVTTAITITGQQLGQGIILRNPAAGATDTIDSAANVVAALSAGLGITSIPNGTTWHCRWIGTTAQTITVAATANTGVTVNRGAIAASSGKDFLVTVVNGTPVQTLAGTTVNASAVVSGFTATQLASLSIGMIVTNAVAGLQGTTIISLNFQAGTVTMSGNANATNTTPVAITFSPVITLDGQLQGLS